MRTGESTPRPTLRISDTKKPEEDLGSGRITNYMRYTLRGGRVLGCCCGLWRTVAATAAHRHKTQASSPPATSTCPAGHIDRSSVLDNVGHPQNNGGDGDSDDNGGPSDGDGNL